MDWVFCFRTTLVYFPDGMVVHMIQTYCTYYFIMSALSFVFYSYFLITGKDILRIEIYADDIDERVKS